jgi:hypothetical protein
VAAVLLKKGHAVVEYKGRSIKLEISERAKSCRNTVPYCVFQAR